MSEKIPLSVFIRNSNDWQDEDLSIITCPYCGYDYNHPMEPNIINGEDDYKADWGGRGDLIVIPFMGECGHNWELCIGFHKGQAFAFARMNWKDTESPSEQVRLLSEEYDYQPRRRFENVAGYQPITEKQINYIQKLAQTYPTVFDDLSLIISGHWGESDINNWTKADGMFVITRLIQGYLFI